MRTQIEIIAFCAAAMGAGYAGPLVCEVGGLNPLFANVPVIVVLALFARRRRGDEILHFVLLSIAVAYCGFLGLVMAVVPSISIAPPHSLTWHPLGVAGPLRNRLPLVFISGIPYALVLSMAVALPVAKIRIGAAKTPNRDDPMWKAIHERAVRPAAQSASRAPDVKG
jgi:hypothetical protein